MAVAADEGAPTVLHGCITTHGEIAIVGPGDACKSGETPQHWSLQTLTGEQRTHDVPGRWAAAEALNGRPCAAPGATAAMIVEVRHYGTRRTPTLRCRVAQIDPRGRSMSPIRFRALRRQTPCGTLPSGWRPKMADWV